MKRNHFPLALAAGSVAILGLSAAGLTRIVGGSHRIHPRSGAPIVVPGKDGDTILLFNGWKLTPAGRHLKTGDFLLGGAFSPDGKTYAITNSGYNSHKLHLIDVESEKEISTITFPKSWSGIVWSPNGKKIYLSGGTNNTAHDIIIVEKGEDGVWKEGGGFKLKNSDRKETMISGLELSKDGKNLFVLNIDDGNLYTLNAETGEQIAKLAVGDHPAVCKISPDGKTLGIACIGSNDLTAVDVSNPAAPIVLGHLPVGAHPNSFALSTDNRLFISCGNDDSVTIFDIEKGDAIGSVKTSLTEKSPEGSTPIALAISSDNRTLYVANADNNDICVIDVTQKDKGVVKGFIPTGWYPTSLALTPDGKRLIVGTGKGLGTTANDVKKPIDTDHPAGFKHHGTQMHGLISFVDVPDDAQLAKYTAQVKANSPYDDSQLELAKSDLKTAIPVRVGAKSPIKHVLYIIKENRTYDQVLGDMPKGNGDPSLVIFGKEVTPNHHALAEQFVLLDNLYCSGEVSADGHPWSTAAYCTEMSQQNWALSYSSHGKIKETDSVIVPRNGYLWDACSRKGLTYRSYGEYVTATSSENAPQPTAVGRTSLKGHESQTWMGIGRPSDSPPMRDTDKADTFIAEFKDFEKTGKMPQFMVMSLGEDHTTGTKTGTFTPKAAVASNDLALGKIVDFISHSKSWKDFAIFVIEDDAQNGADHIDSHRTVGLVISPYSKRGIVDSTMYQTTSMLRSMELILGLPPLSQYDASATPMFASFANRANTTPYTLVAPKIDIAAKNKATDYGALESSKLDFTAYDKADEEVLNRILWRSAKGSRSPLPVAKHAVILSKDKD